MGWDDVVTNHHKQCLKEIRLTNSIETYIETIVLKKTLASIFFEYRRGPTQGGDTVAITVRLDAGKKPEDPLKHLPEAIKRI
ncbi:hypothetical protein PAEPH01_2263 [Pancytospora epiphaga]|nr:hypothetical protein PAEPH01_2263 [Pancytospora epiphaga]